MQTSKIAILLFLPLAVFSLSGCSKQSTQSPKADFGPTSNPALQNTEKPEDPTADASSSELPALPADNTQAIDTELQGIDQELQTVDTSLASDASDGELGL